MYIVFNIHSLKCVHSVFCDCCILTYTCIQSLSWAYVMFKVMLCVHLLSADHTHMYT